MLFLCVRRPLVKCCTQLQKVKGKTSGAALVSLSLCEWAPHWSQETAPLPPLTVWIFVQGGLGKGAAPTTTPLFLRLSSLEKSGLTYW